MKIMISISNRLMQKYMPDPYVLVIVLTFFVMGLAVFLTDSTPVQIVGYWGDGFWSLLTFSMQMIFIVVTGHVMASSPFFKKLLGNLAGTPNSPGQAIILVTLVALIACWINWGFGLIIGALLAREIAKKVDGVDYRLLVASAYSGFIIWSGGLSSSVALTIATPGHFTENLIGVVPTSETLFSPFNLTIVIGLIILVPLINRFMMPPKDQVFIIDRDLLNDPNDMLAAVTEHNMDMTPADRLENSKALSLLTGLLGLAFLGYYITANGFSINLDIINFLFLFIGIILHKTPRLFLEAVAKSVKSATGIIIQFPFYAGLMGIVTASGLAGVLSDSFIAISNEHTFHMLTLWSAGLVNFFVPSGGGQWAVQAPVMLEAAKSMGVSLPKTAMAVAWGDAWTNMIQPFYALPALAIAGLKAKDIMGYGLIIMLITGIFISSVFYFL
ncbi:short-chain fatty acid transporter [Domibacillus sp. DTU_2020_1001157_1_SI_ALB_TIR_016]|uniref:short-chain fatty acid transporter n=1 Tax=Domibacillus sp. DTU_2020_1001157_1_SI_ALB_TIR_016 TaxID=3077789 RepID=UPI0028EF418D|nr:short-chain fatty acid transporter [Domibacillus sp. DTU_2020_1001157_1_SI_ALB_TIR_016]WNS78615.1 short-chain fatty acid transporter [Domibacillus sp. DTU_2020_1001157_1_SI_ALB_TIR_016]